MRTLEIHGFECSYDLHSGSHLVAMEMRHYTPHLQQGYIPVGKIEMCAGHWVAEGAVKREGKGGGGDVDGTIPGNVELH